MARGSTAFHCLCLIPTNPVCTCRNWPSAPSSRASATAGSRVKEARTSSMHNTSSSRGWPLGPPYLH
ncbi:hypothetical protein F751_6145 [Auxenochlorella protothecoides]|uniref:Uncharacterized protein n=1 Tax=Auxenochlorella protothecoides TaxID=3075 RepID=A0A087SHI6_AUXPR|nr:hypothetical protein F751_6145 [Auxenochlorella protothecoides]KFM25190.1 hypothetical protein F751_6145 [Auxenochlorella protothecoides]